MTLNLIAVGYSLGLAASVLYLGALGDRYGRKLLLVLGTTLAIPMSLLAAYAPSDEVLFVARVGGGLAAGMAYPTTLALITALWSGPGRTKSIALWSALGGAIAALGPLHRRRAARALLVGIGLPGHAAAGRASRSCWRFSFVPSHVNETTEPVDNLGGILSVVLVAALILAINFAPVPNEGALVLGLAADRARRGDRASSSGSAARRTRSTTSHIAGRRVFWVAACAGIIVFGSLMGAMFVGQQFLQNVLGYSTLEAGARDPPRRRSSWCSSRRARPSSSRRVRRPVDAARRLRLLPARLPHDAAALEGGHLLLEGRARLRARSASASGSPARRPRTR